MDEKILIADDEQEIADLVELYLKNEGFQVLKCYDGTAAMKAAETEVPDLTTWPFRWQRIRRMANSVGVRLKGFSFKKHS